MFTGRVTRTSTGAMDNILKMANEAKRKEVAVGFPKGMTAMGSGDATNIEKAVFSNFGTRTQPPRPFMSNAMKDNRSKYQSAMKASAKKLMGGTTSVDAVLKKLGIYAQGHIQSEITSLRNPANAASTIKAKGSSNPLIASAEMKQAVTYHVRGK